MIAQTSVPPSPTDEHAVALVEGLVRIPSVSGEETAAVRYLVDAMDALGFDSYVDGAGNAVGVIGTGPEIVLLGHIDTVPGDIPVRVADGKLWGRGAVDAKAPLAAFVIAAARAHRRGVRARLAVIGCVEEEAPSSRGAHYAAARWQPHACIVGEPSGWNRVTLGYKGSLRVTVKLEQGNAHSAHAAWSAPERIVAWWNELARRAEEFNAPYERQWDKLLPSLISLQSGSNGLCTWCTADVSLRLPPTVEPAEALDLVQAIDPMAAVSVSGSVAAWQSPRTDPLARTFSAALRARGVQPALVLKTGTADMNIVGPRWRCPIVTYGPGDAALDHTPDEHLILDEYLRSIDVLEDVLGRWSAGPHPSLEG